MVQWQGTITELSPERDRLLVEIDGQFFAVRCDAPVGAELSPGSRVEVHGTVLGRTQDVVVLQGRRVKLAAAPAASALARR